MELKEKLIGEGLTVLGDVVKVYIPSKIGEQEISREDRAYYVEGVQEALSKLFGGCTSYEAVGCFVDSQNRLITEQVTIVEGFTDKLNNSAIDEVKGICSLLKDDLRQEAVSLEINGMLCFI